MAQPRDVGTQLGTCVVETEQRIVSAGVAATARLVLRTCHDLSDQTAVVVQPVGGDGGAWLRTHEAGMNKSTPFDMILMDMQMPVMDGYEATVQLRAKGYAGKIIALTAHAMASDREKCMQAGCDDYTTKPIDRKNLIQMIRQHIDQKEVASAV